jgi:hypothetical protein
MSLSAAVFGIVATAHSGNIAYMLFMVPMVAILALEAV